MEFSRVDRLQSQIIKEISLIVSDELKDSPPAMITFLRAEVSKDLKYAKIFYSVLGEQSKIDECLIFLKRHNGAIRRLVGQRMRIRHLPEITFHYDSSMENVFRISEILDKLKEDEKSE